MIIQSLSQINSISQPKFLTILGIIKQNIKYSFDRKIELLSSLIITITLHGTYLLAARLICLFFRIESKIPNELLHLDKNSRYIIVANHQARVDPYLILATLPHKTITALLPIRFFTANQYLERWWQRCVLGMFGSFRAYSTDGKISGTRGGLYFSDKGHSLFIFPQGKRCKGTVDGELKTGVGYMAKRRNFTILPVYVSDIKASPGGRTQINWGKPFKLNSGVLAEEPPELTNYIYKAVIALSKSSG